jgi:hypothetical protein
MAEEARQENVRIIKSSSKPRDNLTRAETKALRKLKKNTELTILPADIGCVSQHRGLKTEDTPLIKDQFYRRLARDSTESTERKATLLFLKKSTLTEDISEQVRPSGSRPHRLPKKRKEEAPLRPIFSNTGAPTCQLSKYLAGTH